MNSDALTDAQALSDRELLAKVELLAKRERHVTVALVAHLAVLDERRLYLGEGCASLFTYCTQILHLAEHAAYNRIEAARAARRFPIILQMLAEGSLTLATARILVPHLTLANHEEILAAAWGMSKREAENLVAQLHPLPPVRTVIRQIKIHRGDSLPAAPCPDPELPAGDIPSRQGSQDDNVVQLKSAGPLETSHATAHPTPSSHRVTIEPLGLQRYRVQFTASGATCDKIRLARDLLSHQILDGDLAEIIDRALTLLVETLVKERFAATDRPKSPPTLKNEGPTAQSRHIPAAVRRAVWLRDVGRCAFVARDGRRCGERRLLEFHHVEPYGVGGLATVDNIGLRCRAHNRYEAELYFGPDATAISMRPRSDAEVKPLSGTDVLATNSVADDRGRGHPGRPSVRASPG